MNVAFKPPVFQISIFVLSDLLIDICFYLDIIISFRTTYQNPYTGDEIYDGWLIAKNYFFGRFVIDFFSTIQFD